MKIKTLAILSLTTVICSCFSFPKESKQLTPQCPVYPETCLVLDLPPPIPDQVHITIEQGKVIADSGGELLIRNYAATRKRIKQWQDAK